MSDSSEIYKQYRDKLLDALRSNYEQYDKSILTLSGGGLALTLIFISNIVSVESVSYTSLLIISWVFFIGAIITTILSFIFSQQAIETQIDYAEKYYIEDKQEYFNKKNVFSIITKFLNYFSATFFVLAIIFTITFASINITQRGYEMNDTDSKKNKEIQKENVKTGSYVPPKMQTKTNDPEIIEEGYVPSKTPKIPEKKLSETPKKDKK